jgi:hypothetical protein
VDIAGNEEAIVVIPALIANADQTDPAVISALASPLLSMVTTVKRETRPYRFRRH